MSTPEMQKPQVVKCFIMLIFLILISGCFEKEKNPITPYGYSDWSYPLAIGNHWEYTRVFSSFNFRIDSAGVDSSRNYQDSSKIRVEIIGIDSLPHASRVFVFQESDSLSYGGTLTQYFYYGNQKSGLYLYAYSAHGSAGIIPKLSSREKIYFKGYTFQRVREITDWITKSLYSGYPVRDTLTLEIPPLRTLVYPPIIGWQWTYRPAGDPIRIDKRIIERVPVRGLNEVYKVQWLLDIDDDGKWDEIEFYDHVSEKGLLYRLLYYKDMTLLSDTGDPIGLFDGKDEININFIHLN